MVAGDVMMQAQVRERDAMPGGHQDGGERQMALSAETAALSLFLRVLVPSTLQSHCALYTAIDSWCIDADMSAISMAHKVILPLSHCHDGLLNVLLQAVDVVCCIPVSLACGL